MCSMTAQVQTRPWRSEIATDSVTNAASWHNERYCAARVMCSHMMQLTAQAGFKITVRCAACT